MQLIFSFYYSFYVNDLMILIRQVNRLWEGRLEGKKIFSFAP